MKKTFLALLAAVAFVGCSNNELIETPTPELIGFGAPFVDNATRVAIDPSYSGTKPLTSFKVYGTVTGNGNIVNVFDGDAVTGKVGDDVWACTEEQYWVPNCSYNFTAIADATSVAVDANGMPTSITFNENTTAGGDVLISTATASTNAQGTPTQNPVAFTFTHLLSKAKFTFTKAAYNNTRYTFNVKDIKFTNPYKQGVYNISNGTWGSQDIRTSTIDFGPIEAVISTTALSQESNYERMFVPATYTDLGVEYTLVTLLDGKEIGSETKTATLGATTAVTFEAGNAYNIIATLGANNLITFTVEELKGWDTETNITIP